MRQFKALRACPANASDPMLLIGIKCLRSYVEVNPNEFF